MLPLLLVFQLAATSPSGPKRPVETLALLDQARTLAPEFHADILLRLANSSVIPDRAWKLELIEEAFRAAPKAYLPYRQNGESNTDTRSARAVWDNDLEALTLQTRAVEAMLPLDPRHARELFEEMVAPQLSLQRCQDVLQPDVSAYYRTAAQVFQRSFNAREREQQDDTAFLVRVISTLHAAAQEAPVLRLVLDTPMTPAQRMAAASAFAAALEAIPGSGNRLAASGMGSVPGDGPATRDVATVLLPALRTYLVRQLAAPDCKGAFEARDGSLPGTAAQFNALIARLDPAAATYRPIVVEELKNDKVEPGYERHPWWQSTRSKEVINALKWLNHGNRDLPDGKRFWTLEERRRPEWQERFDATLKLIEGWKEDEEASRDDWFGMASESYALLADKAPPGKQRDTAMGMYLIFMETNYALIENHNLWFTQLGRMRRANDPWLNEQMLRSASPAIALYSRVHLLKQGAGK